MCKRSEPILRSIQSRPIMIGPCPELSLSSRTNPEMPGSGGPRLQCRLGHPEHIHHITTTAPFHPSPSQGLLRDYVLHTHYFPLQSTMAASRKLGISGSTSAGMSARFSGGWVQQKRREKHRHICQYQAVFATGVVWVGEVIFCLVDKISCTRSKNMESDKFLILPCCHFFASLLPPWVLPLLPSWALALQELATLCAWVQQSPMKHSASHKCEPSVEL